MCMQIEKNVSFNGKVHYNPKYLDCCENESKMIITLLLFQY